MYTWERPRKPVKLIKIAETLTLNISYRQKRILRVWRVFRDSKGEKGSWHGDGKANVWQTNGNLKKQTLIGPFLITHLVHAIVIYGDSSLPGTVQGRAQTFTPNLWGFDCFQLKIIPMPEILGGKFFSPILGGQTLHISPCTECKGGFSKYTWKSSEEWIKKIWYI